MTGESITLETVPGTKTVASAGRLIGRRLLLVEREGLGYDVMYLQTGIGDREVCHIILTGKLKFKHAFTAGERVRVLIKHEL